MKKKIRGYYNRETPNSTAMKKLSLFIIIAISLLFPSCKKEKERSERFLFLTTPIWESQGLLANGADASGPGGILENFKGDAKFETDGTGYFGSYTGTWRLSNFDTELTIIPDSNPLPIICNIINLSETSLVVETQATVNQVSYAIRMSFATK